MLASHSQLSPSQKALLKRGNIITVSDLVLTPTQDVARRCRVSPLEIKAIVDAVCRSKPIQAPNLAQLLSSSNLYGACTSGDPHLDAALGGGFRTGMIWEIVGESAAGKTQLALRMSLLAQLPEEHGGLAGSACYLITSGKLPTSRLLQISQSHSLLASLGQSSLDDIHTMPVPSINFLADALSKLVPDFIQQRLNQNKSNSTVKPVRLLVIDALGELFHSSAKTSTQTLVQRSQNIADISASLHSIASTYGIVVLVLNEVVDAFDRAPSNGEDSSIGLSYVEHSQWFGRAHSIEGEDRKEASLGLVWANQVNARIMMSRTGRRKFTHLERPEKRQRTNDGYNEKPSFPENAENLELVRRISVVFSSVCSPGSLDYIVDSGGITVLEDEEVSNRKTVVNEPVAVFPSVDLPPASQIAPLDVGFIEGESAAREFPSEPSTAPDDEDGWEAYWEKNEITEEMASFDP